MSGTGSADERLVLECLLLEWLDLECLGCETSSRKCCAAFVDGIAMMRDQRAPVPPHLAPGKASRSYQHGRFLQPFLRRQLICKY
ncbi:hypothetical protein ACQR1W_34140 [Bradyrhizobium sp. HKCCYLS1011]|uniref:hypothetical protein n=1 Tax=Bradyrhizobium sp. HKCCYLS1011 TaxID=3420733 RepID=UPI003EBCDF9B